LAPQVTRVTQWGEATADLVVGDRLGTATFSVGVVVAEAAVPLVKGIVEVLGVILAMLAAAAEQAAMAQRAQAEMV
jgi:hypothetical protein